MRCINSMPVKVTFALLKRWKVRMTFVRDLMLRRSMRTNDKTPFCHHLHKLAQTELVAQLPANTQNNYLALEMTARKRFLQILRLAYSPHSLRSARHSNQFARAICSRARCTLYRCHAPFSALVALLLIARAVFCFQGKGRHRRPVDSRRIQLQICQV
jgi:hypothetical protein